MRSSRGQVTLDFLFAVVLILGFTSLLFVVSFTLTVASITQYITYSAARNYLAGHLSPSDQEVRAKAKYNELINDPVFKPLYAGGWFKINAAPNVGDHTKIIPAYAGASEGFNEFQGVGTDFVAKILDFHIPFFGSTAPDGDGQGSGFKTYLGSYMGREPSERECLDFIAQRWTAIRTLQVSLGAGYGSGTSPNGYFPMADDGC